jgi:glycosyltransferase involved in cell wall biosynthesis
MGEEIERLGFPVYSFGIESVLDLPRGLAAIVRLIRSFRPHIVNTWLYQSDLIGGLAARVAGVKAIAWNIRNSNLLPGKAKLSTRLMVRLNAMLSRHVPVRILCCSVAARDVHVREGYDPGRFLIIPNGFDIKEYSPSPEAGASVRAEFGIPSDHMLVGLFARWHPQKDHEGFINAAALLRMRFPKVFFILAGTGVTWENANLRDFVDRAELSGNVRLLGLRGDMPRLTAALDIACSSSIFGEAFQNVIGEAMSCGVPVVATDVGDAAYIIGETGVVVRPSDFEALADGIEKLLVMSIEHRRALGALARRRVEEFFSLSEVCRRYEGAYREMAQFDSVRSD